MNQQLQEPEVSFRPHNLFINSIFGLILILTTVLSEDFLKDIPIGQNVIKFALRYFKYGLLLIPFTLDFFDNDYYSKIQKRAAVAAGLLFHFLYKMTCKQREYKSLFRIIKIMLAALSIFYAVQWHLQHDRLIQSRAVYTNVRSRMFNLAFEEALGQPGLETRYLAMESTLRTVVSGRLPQDQELGAVLQGFRLLYQIRNTRDGSTVPQKIAHPKDFQDAARRLKENAEDLPDTHDVQKILAARLFLTASQNGLNERNVKESSDAIESISPLPVDKIESRDDAIKWSCFYHIKGATYKLRAQCGFGLTSNAESGAGWPNVMSRTELVDAAFQNYELARRIAKEHRLPQSLRRIQNNRIDLLLYVLATLIEARTTDLNCEVDLPQLSHGIQDYLPHSHSYHDILDKLELIRLEIVEVWRESLRPEMLITEAQALGLIATLTQSERDRVSEHDAENHALIDELSSNLHKYCSASMSRLEIGLLAIRDVRILRDLSKFYLDILEEHHLQRLNELTRAVRGEF